MRALTAITAVRTAAGRPAVVGVCEECGAQLIHLGGSLVTNAPVLGKTYPMAISQTINTNESKRLLSLGTSVATNTTTLPSTKPVVSKMARQKVTIIAGIGENITQKLAGANIKTIGKLAGVKLGKKIAGITDNKLLELKAAAELVLSSTASSDVFSALADETLSSVLYYSATELTDKVNCSVEQIEQFQQRLRTLLFLLDNDIFQELKVSKVLT